MAMCHSHLTHSGLIALLNHIAYQLKQNYRRTTEKRDGQGSPKGEEPKKIKVSGSKCPKKGARGAEEESTGTVPDRSERGTQEEGEGE